MKRMRLLIGSVALTGLVLLAAVLVLGFTSEEARSGDIPSSRELLADLAQSDDECVACHTTHTPGIVQQYSNSDHYNSDVSCADCHSADENYPGAVKHPNAEFYVLTSSSTAKCETCHAEQVAQFNLSRHALPSYVAYAGDKELSAEHLALYQSIPEGGSNPAGRARNIIHQFEGEEFTPFTCQSCHDIGAPNMDGSVGDCTACHIRHEFNLEQARKPETCNACHIGPDHPQWEIYTESSHGIAYTTRGDTWNWEAEAGSLTTADFPAPTCATCHFSGFGLSGTTHDVGDRLSWYLAAPLTTARPNSAENRVEMQNVCRACHSNSFVAAFYEKADAATEVVNEFVRFSDLLLKPLRDKGLITPQPMDEPIEYLHYELWHHYGRTAKSGVWMQGADYAQWHGIYEIIKLTTEIHEMANQILVANGEEELVMPEGFPGIDAVRIYLAENAPQE
jgi:hypothetical protein